MDTNNWRPTQGASGIGDPNMEYGDWRAQLQRQKIVNKIMDTLKRNLPFTGYERLQELKKIAERVEQEIYTAATSQSEYSRKICLNMLIMDTRLQNIISESLQSNSAAFYDNVSFSVTVPLGPIDNPNGGDWQEEVYQKIKAMKELYLLDLGPTQGANGSKVTQHVMNNHWQQFVTPVPYQKQQMMSQSMHNNIGSTEMQASSSLSFAGHNSNLQNVHYMFTVPQNHLTGQQYDYSNMVQRPQQRLQSHQNMLSSLQPPSHPSASDIVGDLPMEAGDWRAQLPADSRRRIQNKILDTLIRHLPVSGHEGQHELKKIADRFEEKIFNAATSQSDYLRKVSLKMLTMETRPQDPTSNLIQLRSDASSANP